MLSQDELKKLLHYNHETGQFTWITNGLNRRAGRPAGNVCSAHGYVRIGINRKTYRAHHLAFLYMTGEIVENVDHINGVRHDNRWRNLRRCTVQQNNMNKQIRADNKSGVPGVNWYECRKKWRVTIRVNGKFRSLGYFGDFEFAELVSEEARDKFFGDFSATKRGTNSR
ncbi:TPA: HNH endonuclease [Escherichia coli]|nr:HNH endonuclease [Escherichia coli]